MHVSYIEYLPLQPERSNADPLGWVGIFFFSFSVKLVKTSQPVMGNVRESSSLLASTAGIALKQPDDGRVALGSFDEFLKGQFTWETQTQNLFFSFMPPNPG